MTKDRNGNGAPIEGTTDDQTVARARAGDRHAYAALVRRHAPVALRTALLMGAGSEAEDVVQEAFVKAYAGLRRIEDDAAFRPWLLRIVANETRNLQRGSIRRRAREDLTWTRTEPLLRAPGPDDVALALERRDALVSALGRLSVRDRQVVVCRYLLELDEAETSSVLGWPRGTVKSRLSRALGRLRADVEGVLHE